MPAIGSVTVPCPGCAETITVPLRATAVPSSARTLTVALEADTSVVDEHKAAAHKAPDA